MQAQIQKQGGRLRLRFGLKALLLLTTVAGMLLAIVAGPLAENRRQSQLFSRFVGLGAKVNTYGSVSITGLGPLLLGLFDSRYQFSPLYGFDFAGTKVTDDDLADLGRLHYVQRLNLNKTQVTDEGLKRVSGWPYLTHLDLSGTAVSDRGVGELISCRRLDLLNVEQTAVTCAALKQLDDAVPYPHFRQQRAIAELRAAGVQVADNPNWMVYDPRPDSNGLREGQSVSTVIVGMTHAATFSAAQVDQLNSLETVEFLDFHTVTFDAGALASLERLPKLKDLEFWMTNLNDSDLDAVGRQTQLEELVIYDCAITSEGLSQLHMLTHLKKLEISGRGVTRAAVDALRKKLIPSE